VTTSQAGRTEESALAGRSIAIPETRQLDTLAALLESRGATVLRCPLVAILDNPEERPVLDWLARAIEQRFDLLILFTGEGLERLLGFAERAGRRDEFLDALRATPKLCRGPKPTRVLRRLELAPELSAAAPTTAGIIETLAGLQLAGKRIGVQLYGAEDNVELRAYLGERGAQVDTVAPYIYASAADDARVIELIHSLSQGAIAAIAFTNKTQVERLERVARQQGLADELSRGLSRTKVAAVGPVVAAELRAAGVGVDAMPDHAYFMKPLVTELVRLLATPAASR